MLAVQLLCIFAALILATAPVDPVPRPAEPGWTLLVYGGADKDADGPLQRFLDRLLRPSA